MKIINIVPGFGGTFYCGNCLRDSVYTTALKASGHEAITLPVYLPLSVYKCETENELPVFYGAVNIYLKQNFKIFRGMPQWMERLFNSDSILAFAAKKAGSTRASGLEDMTISMLKGKEGRQNEELQHMIDFLKNHEKPDIVHLSNALLLGMAKQIKEQLNIPVVCSLQDEDVWIDAMDIDTRKSLWDLLSEKGQDVDAFVAVSEFYAEVMKKKMNIPEEKMHTTYIGVDPSKYTYNKPNANIPTIGYLSRMNDENGFEILIDAFIHLKENSEFKNARLRLSGGMTDDDKKFIKKQVKKLKLRGFDSDVEFVEDFREEAIHTFLSGLTVLSVPVLNGEAFGLYQLEALASGIPLVQPALGAFPEIAEVTKGGLIYQPNTPEKLSEKLNELFQNSELLLQLSINGRKSVEQIFNSEVITNQMLKVYQTVSDQNNKLGKAV